MFIHLYLTISERRFCRKGHRKVYNIFSEDKHRKQTITFFATDNYNPIFSFFLKKRRTRARKADESVRFKIEENSFII